MNKQRFWLFPIFLVVYELVLYLANDAYLPALLDISHYFSIDSTQVMFTLTAFFIGNSCFQLFLGPLSDNYGRRIVLITGGVGFCLGSLLCALSGNFTLVLLGRFLQGLAVSTMNIAGYGTIHALLDEKRAIQTLAWMGAVTVLAPAFGPFLGAFFMMFATWQQLFLSLCLLGLVALICLSIIMPETATVTDKANIKQTFRHYRTIFSNRYFLSPLLSLAAIFAANIAWISAGSLITIQGFHFSTLQYGLYQAGIFSCYLLGARIVNRQIKKTDAETIKIWTLFLCFVVIGLALITLMSIQHQMQWLMLTLMSLSLTSGIAFPVYNRLSIEKADEPMGIRMAVFSFTIGLSATIGSLCVSIFYQGHLSHFLWVLIAFCTLPILLQPKSVRQFLSNPG